MNETKIMNETFYIINAIWDNKSARNVMDAKDYPPKENREYNAITEYCEKYYISPDIGCACQFLKEEDAISVCNDIFNEFKSNNGKHRNPKNFDLTLKVCEQNNDTIKYSVTTIIL